MRWPIADVRSAGILPSQSGISRPRRPRYARARCPRYGAGRRGGQVLIITLIAMTMLVGLIFYVYNLGSIMNRRVTSQQAADATAVSGADWMARSMNVVAMNNCAQSRAIALVPVLDALPLASAISYAETNEWEKGLEWQLKQNITETARSKQLLLSSLSALQTRMATERDILNPMDQAMNHSGFDMRRTTCWAIDAGGGGGQHPEGMLWQAALAMDDMNEATADSAGALAQSNAVMFGKENGVETAMLVPILPPMPARRGDFQNFQYVLQGQEQVNGTTVIARPTSGAGGAIVDAAFPHRLGPWARLFRWRDYISKATAWEWVPPSGGPVAQTRGAGGGSVALGGRSAGGGVGVGGGGGNNGSNRATEFEVTGYNTYGPFSWAMRAVSNYCYTQGQVIGHLVDTYFYQYLNQLAAIKLNYMFSSQAIQSIHESNYVVDYANAHAIAKDPNYTIYSTLIYKIQVKSSVAPADNRWLTAGTYVSNQNNSLATWVSGWIDPEKWTVPKIATHIWRDEWTYQTTLDNTIGIAITYDESNNPVWHDVWMVDWYVWGGIDIGGNVEVRNPANWSSGERRPAPWLLDTSNGDIDPQNNDWDAGVRRSTFSYLGIARTADTAPVWPQRFAGASPIKSVVAVAQAKVFNHSSWDLWTQDWQAELMPVSLWSDWAQRLADGKGDLGSVKDVSAGDLDQMQKYIESLKDAAEPYVNH